jgi:gliding motility-associated-like protein
MVVNNPACVNDTGIITLYITPSPIVTVTGPLAPICYGSIDSLRATGGGTYVWTPGGIPGPIIGIRPLVNTTYYVTVTNTYNCSTVDSYPVTVIPPGIADAGSDQSICAGDVVTLTGSQVNGTGLYWTSSGDGTFNPDTVSSPVTYNPGVSDTTSGAATIYLTTIGACLDQSDSVFIQISGQPVLIAAADTTISSDPSMNATIPLLTTSTNVTSVLWTTSGSGVFIPSDTSLSAEYDPSDDDYKANQIFIIGTTTGNCASAIDTLVIDFTPFFIPNVFTPYPLSPGFNDYFTIDNYDTKVGLKVYDRWGAIVYSSDHYQNDWDGRGLEPGVYYYVVLSPQKEYKGWVQLIRE